MDIFTVAAKLRLDSGDFVRQMRDAENGGKGLANTLEKSFSKIQSLAKAAIAGFATKKLVDAFIKPAVDAYASYEQLVGGVDTLFKDSSKKVQAYADNAYKTAGMSANQYMETVTSFSASLLQSLKGNTDAAADVADMAIQDMSDNANKMGTDISAIQNAYQGFAKQNYTMLDNLKLGYGGTKTEMERLLKDAQKLTGQKYNINRLADVYKAIHAIQEEMGITGTTSKEAGETIQGSLAALKASWENMLVAVSSGDKDVSKATKTLVDSGKTVLRNVVPAIKRSLSGIGQFMKEIGPILGQEVPKLIADTAPELISAGWEMIKGLGRGLIEAARTIQWPTWDEISAGAIKLWDDAKKGVAAFGGLVFGKNEKGEVNWPTIEELQDAAKDLWGKLKSFVANVFNLGGKLIFGTDKTNGEVKWPSIDDLKNGAKELWGDLKTFVANAFNLGGKLIFGETTNGEVKWPDVETLKKTASDLWTELTDYVKALPALVFGENSVVSSALTNAFSFVQDVGNWIITNADAVALGMGAIMAAFAIDKLLAVNPLLLGIAAGATLVIANWEKVKEVIGEVQSAVEEFKRSLEPVNNWFLQLQGGGKGALVPGQVADLVNDYKKVKTIENSRGSESGQKAFETFKNNFARELREAGVSAEEIEQALNNIDLSWTTQQMEEYINSFSTASAAAKALKDDLDSVAGNYDVNININTNGTIPDIPLNYGQIPNPKYVKKAIGDWNVPYDNYPTLLHRNEMVLNATHARQYREGKGGGAGIDLDAMVNRIVAAVTTGIENANIDLDGEKITRNVNRRLAASVRAKRFA